MRKLEWPQKQEPEAGFVQRAQMQLAQGFSESSLVAMMPQRQCWWTTECRISEAAVRTNQRWILPPS